MELLQNHEDLKRVDTKLFANAVSALRGENGPQLLLKIQEKYLPPTQVREGEFEDEWGAAPPAHLESLAALDAIAAAAAEQEEPAEGP